MLVLALNTAKLYHHQRRSARAISPLMQSFEGTNWGCLRHRGRKGCRLGSISSGICGHELYLSQPKEALCSFYIFLISRFGNWIAIK
jgi:hypothetical protein